MSDGPLSQEEIRALFASVETDENTPAAGAAGGDLAAALAQVEEHLAAAYDIAADSLGQLLEADVTLGRPAMAEMGAGDVLAALPQPGMVVRSELSQGLSGTVLIVLGEETIQGLVARVMPEGGADPAAKQAAIGEIGTQLLASLANHFSQVVGTEVGLGATEVLDSAAALAAGVESLGLGTVLAQAYTPLAVGGEPAGEWLLLLDLTGVSGLLDDQAAAAAAAAVIALPQRTAPAPAPQPAVSAAAPALVQTAAPARAAAQTIAPAPAPVAPVPTPQPQPSGAPSVAVQMASFGELGRTGAAGENQNIDLLLDVPLQLTVELGRTRRPIKDVLALGPGSVIELDRLAGEPVDVLVNGKLVAKGEVVVIDENFGVRITDVVSPAERVRSL